MTEFFSEISYTKKIPFKYLLLFVETKSNFKNNVFRPKRKKKKCLTYKS